MNEPAFKPINDRLQAIQQDYFQRLSALMTSPEEAGKVAGTDRRFAGNAWLNNPPFSAMAALYLLNSEALMAMTDALDMEPKAQQKLKFMVQQWVDATSPANYLATNPEAQQKMLDTKGESLRAGIEHLLRDMNKGRISQTDESVFELGKNLATTPGSVVYENEVFQLIQYAPSTPKVGSRPLLLVPPSINKFYIMDLQPESSLGKFAVDQGNTVFLISWRNPGEDQGQLRWDDYVENGILKAIEASNEIAGSDDLNVLGFCVGGTMTVTALAVLAARGQSPVHSLTLMTTLVDFDNTGVLDIFINEDHVIWHLPLGKSRP
ncbi:MAG: PHA/PHB synthase family protein, partial [Burkholderiaceae bacterium]